MSKYIVKNCPAFCKKNFYFTCENLDVGEICCSDCTDCLIKQVIEKCMIIECPCELESLDCPECSIRGQKTFADTILQLFEIEECDNEDL